MADEEYITATTTEKGVTESPIGDDKAETASNLTDLSVNDRRYLIRRPRALQYFENGVLRKASDKERTSGRFELFFDLLYVALVWHFFLYIHFWCFDIPSNVERVLPIALA